MADYLTTFTDFLRDAKTCGAEAMRGGDHTRGELLAAAQLNATMATAVALDRIADTLEEQTAHA